MSEVHREVFPSLSALPHHQKILNNHKVKLVACEIIVAARAGFRDVSASGSIIAASGYSSNGGNVVVWDTLAPPATSQASTMCHEDIEVEEYPKVPVGKWHNWSSLMI
ncbi:uncharacterized protein LOC142544805 [Primulina tabacum]|uniref:uncharacterized protein LOC142544805 n=1 Tax=Primulina tabacum TaxID=48773 RepID=UPI003F5ADCE4